MEMANKNGVVRVPNLPAKGLQRFVITNKHVCYRNPGNVDDDDEEEDSIELNLGLSSNGRFGTDPTSRKRKNCDYLTRSSSIPEGLSAGETRHPAVPLVRNVFQMTRTLSLPVDSGEEDRRRKELQNRRRMEARKKRSEKMRASGELHTPPAGDTNSGGEGEDSTGREKARNILENMPSVTTRVVGADGKRVEGFLYWFGGREDVRIVCVCHGFFLSPADFLRHGGASFPDGGDHFVNPLRHIVVRPPSSL